MRRAKTSSHVAQSRGSLQGNKTQLLCKEMKPLETVTLSSAPVLSGKPVVFLPYLDCLPPPSSCCHQDCWQTLQVPAGFSGGAPKSLCSPVSLWSLLQLPVIAVASDGFRPLLPSPRSAFYTGTGVTLPHCDSPAQTLPRAPGPGGSCWSREDAHAHTRHLAFISNYQYNEKAQ